MKWSELKHITRCAIVHIVCAILCILLLTFCSCDDYHYSQGGVITDIDKVNTDSYGRGHAYFRCKVHCHSTWLGLSTDFYLLTDSAYQIGDWVQIK